jgi:hypothetical protein
MSDMLFTRAVAEIADGREAKLVVEVPAMAVRLVEQAQDASPADTPESTLAPFDELVDELMATTSALIAVGGREAGLRGVAVSLRILAAGSSSQHGVRNVIAEALLSRATLVLFTMALAWERVEALPMLATVAPLDTYGPPVGVLVDRDLRHPELYGNDAGEAFAANVEWLISRPWRASVPPLASDRSVRVRAAEADIIGACLVNAASESAERRGAFSPGVAQPDQAAQDQLVARLGDPRQRASLCELFSCSDEALEETLETAYKAITVGASAFIRRSTLLVRA